jgi:hypothetical protein
LRKAAAITAVMCITGIAPSLAKGSTGGEGANADYYTAARKAVCYYFGEYCSQAMQIVRCETGGTYYPWAQNGQYLGIFQMGSRERAKYGHGSNVWAQAKAAYAYFKDAGWHPWLDFQPAGCGG